ncbi:MAG: HAD-IA family hydrolase [Bacteroidota bacterium]
MVIKHLLFDWGDTLMRDFPIARPMYTWEHVELIEGVEKVLKKLLKKYILSVATNAGMSDEVAVRKAFKRVDIEKYFSHFFTSKELGFQKPDQRFFQAISNKLNTKPENCVMIGNSYEKDIIGAFQSGMKTIYFNEKKLAGTFEKANIVISRFEEISEVILNIHVI